MSSAPSPSASAAAKASGSMANSAGDSLLSAGRGRRAGPLSYFLSRSRTGRSDESPGVSSTTGGTAGQPAAAARHRRPSCIGRRVAERLQLVGVDQLVVVEVEPAERRRRRRPARPWRAGRPCRGRGGRRGRRSCRSASRPTWTRNGPRRRPEGVGQLVDRDDAVLRVDVELAAGHGRGRRRWRRRTSVARAALVGLLRRERAVAVAVEAGVQRPDRVEPGRAERPVAQRRSGAGGRSAGCRPGRSRPGPRRGRGRRRPSAGGGVGGGAARPGPRRAPRAEDGERSHPRTSWIGLALGSTIRIGRPTSDDVLLRSGRSRAPCRRWRAGRGRRRAGP